MFTRIPFPVSPESESPSRGAGAPRRATADPDRFLIPAESLPPGFADRVDDPELVPAVPRPAATVALVREGGRGPEVLLLRRPRRSAFAADAWVFPGGVVDEADADPGLRELVLGPTPEEWAGRLGLEDPAEALGYVVAALREAWEETGILIGPERERAGGARRELLAGDPLVGLARREGLRLDAGRLLYIAHWITPEPEPRRYDTRFFLARVPSGAECRLLGEELTEARWVGPGEAVAGFMAGKIKLLPPTVHTLRRLAGFGSLDEAWAALRDAPVPAFLPRMHRDPDGVVVEVVA